MSKPVQLTPDALESPLGDLDGSALGAFVADLYERGSQGAKQEGRFITTTGRDGDDERLLVWTDDRTGDHGHHDHAAELDGPTDPESECRMTDGVPATGRRSP